MNKPRPDWRPFAQWPRAVAAPAPVMSRPIVQLIDDDASFMRSVTRLLRSLGSMVDRTAQPCRDRAGRLRTEPAAHTVFP